MKEDLTNKIIREEYEKRHRFMIESIKNHCNWWQILYVKLAMKFRLKIWFIDQIIQKLPHELNSEFIGFNFGIQEKYGVKINGKIHWL